MQIKVTYPARGLHSLLSLLDLTFSHVNKARHGRRGDSQMETEKGELRVIMG